MKERREAGQLLIIVAIGMTVFLGFAALVVDLGQGYSHRRLAQNAADAAALAGMRLVREQANAPTPMTGAQIYQAIQQVAAQNGNAQLLPNAQGGAVFLDANLSPLPGGNVQSWVGADYSDVFALRVKTSIQYNALFAGIFGRSSMTSGGEATAASFASDMGGALPVAFKTYAPCGNDPDFGFENDPGPQTYYDETNHWWKFFTNDPGVAGGFGWISLDGSSASASTVADWIVNGFHGTYSWWTNYRWDNGMGQYGGWTWNNGTGWYQANAPVADTTACNGYYDDGRSGSFDWTNPGTKPNSTPAPSWGTPPPPMPTGHDMVDASSMHPGTGSDPNTLMGYPYMWMLNNTGMGLNSTLKTAISQMVGHDAMIFVYNSTDGTGSNAKLQVIGMAGFTIENVIFNGSNTEIWGLYRGAVLPGNSKGVLDNGMMTTVRLVSNVPGSAYPTPTATTGPMPTATLLPTFTPVATATLTAGPSSTPTTGPTATPTTGPTASATTAPSSTATPSPTATAVPLQTPTNFTATHAGNKKIQLGWNSVSGATSYQIDRTNPDGTHDTLITTGTSYLDSGLISGATYTYSVRAVNSATQSAWSAPASASS